MGQLGWVWFGGTRDKIYCIPFRNIGGNLFGIIDSNASRLRLDTLGANPAETYQWITAVLVRDRIYCIPFTDIPNQVRTDLFGIIQTLSDTLTLTTLNTNASNYFWLSCAAVDDFIYCVPGVNSFGNNGGNQFGIINTLTNTVSLTNFGLDPAARYYWASCAAVNDKIYCIPSTFATTSFPGQNNKFGILDTKTNTLTAIDVGANPTTVYAWTIAISVGSKVYCIPSPSSVTGGNQFGILDTTTNTITLSTLGLNPSIRYEWFSAVKVGTRIYCIPANPSSTGDYLFGILETLTNNLTITTLGLSGSTISYSWFASALADQKIYCIPGFGGVNNFFGVLNTVDDTLSVVNLQADLLSTPFDWRTAVSVSS